MVLLGGEAGIGKTALARAFGARPAADAVASRPRELGVRRLPRRPRRATLANPAGPILAKLGVRSRRDAARVATARGIGAQSQDGEPAAPR
jgi:hypothetical protein